MVSLAGVPETKRVVGHSDGDGIRTPRWREACDLLFIVSARENLARFGLARARTTLTHKARQPCNPPARGIGSLVNDGVGG